MLYAVRWSIWHLHRHVPCCMLFAMQVPRTRLDEPMADGEQALGRTLVAEELDGLNVHARPAHFGLTGHTERCRRPMRPLQWAAALWLLHDWLAPAVSWMRACCMRSVAGPRAKPGADVEGASPVLVQMWRR